MKKRTRVTIGLIAIMMTLACTAIPGFGGSDTPSIPTEFPTIAPIATLEPTVAPVTANVLFTDDFTVAPSAEMEEYSGDDGFTGTQNGIYIVRATSDVWQWGKSNSTFQNTVVEVDVAMATGPANNNAGFGVICRLTEREDTSVDGYMLAISGDGYYTIRSITAGSMSPLVDWAYSDVINQGITVNKVRATCNGTDLRLEVNGQLVASATTIPGGSESGSIAFSAISFETDQPVAEGHFDNLVVSEP